MSHIALESWIGAYGADYEVFAKRHPTKAPCENPELFIIGTLRGVRGRGVGDYTSLNRPYYVLIMAIKAPKGPYDFVQVTTIS